MGRRETPSACPSQKESTCSWSNRNEKSQTVGGKRTSRHRSSRGSLAEGDQGIAEGEHSRIPVIAAPGDGRLQPDRTGKRFRDDTFATQAACRVPDQTDVPMKGYSVQ